MLLSHWVYITEIAKKNKIKHNKNQSYIHYYTCKQKGHNVNKFSKKLKNEE